MYEVGDLVLLTHAPLDVDGNAATVSGGILTITLPDGTTATPTVTSGSGTYRAEYAAAQLGRHTYRWVFSGPEPSVYADVFVVADNVSLVQLDEAIAHLRGANVFATSPEEREKLRALCQSATAICESYIRRPLAVRTFIETHSGDCDFIALNRTPVVSVTSVTETGSAISGSDYQLDSVTGFLYRGTSATPLYWLAGRLNVVVTYKAGYTNPPADLRLAVLREVEHLWQRTQNAPHPGMGDNGFDELQQDNASAMPWPVRYLLAPHVQSGFA